jgi:iron(III) transport system substrate-binding protein
VLQRGLTEIKAGRYTVDVFENSGRELEALSRENVLQAVSSPTISEILPEAVPAHHQWVGSRLNLVVGVFNTNLVTAADLPKSWEGFLDPQWKGKLAIENEDYDWFSAIAQEFPSEEAGVDFFKKLVATNGVSVRKGHTLLTNLTASGEVPLAFTVFDFTAKQVKEDGAPLDLFTIGPVPARVNGVAVSKFAPHPNSALLFHEFMIGEGQDILQKRGVTTTNIKRHPFPEETKIKIIDPAFLLDHGKKWSDLYDQIVVSQN